MQYLIWNIRQTNGEMELMTTKRGYCHICGELTDLTFEHIPPRKALNNVSTKIYSGVDILKNKQTNKLDDTIGLRYQNQQRGAGRYTLCSRCNNNTGAYYAPHYIEFALSVAYMLKQEKITEAVGTHLETKEMNCLAVFKQIISMFCSTSSSDTFAFEFKDFLLNKESTQFDRERWGVYLYVNVGSRSGTSGMITLFYKQKEKELAEPPSILTVRVGEIITYPLGMVLFDRRSQHQPDQIGLDITEMSSIPYGKKPHTIMDLPYHDKAVFMPGI